VNASGKCTEHGEQKQPEYMYSKTFSLEHSARLVHFRQPELIPD
jgi:hypothetical protein